MSGGKIAAVIIVILVVTWLLLLTLGRLGFMSGSTQKYVKDRKWDKMKEELTKLYKADGTKNTTVCKTIRDWWADNQDDYNKFIEDQDGDPETLNDWSFGFPAEIKFADFVDEYFDDVGKQNAEIDFIDIANGNSLCEDELDLAKLKENVVRIITPVADQVDGYDPLAGDCSNVTSEQSVLPNYVWSYDDDTFIDISGMQDTEIGSTDWRKKVKMVCKPLAMDEEYVPAGSDSSGATTNPQIKFTNVANPITGTKIEVFEEGTSGLATNLSYTFTDSTITSFEIDVTGSVNFIKPLYVIKLDGKETDHIFAGNVGTIAFVTSTTGTSPNEVTTTDYSQIMFTPNINIGTAATSDTTTGITYDIILEADTFPKPVTGILTAVHSCAVGSKTVAQITGQTFAASSPVSFTQEDCYSKAIETDAASVIPFVAAKYTAYIRKTKTSTNATDPENPQYKFATLTRAAVATTGST